MRRGLALLLVGLLSMVAVPAAQTGSWPMFQGDSIHSGSSTDTIPTQLDVFWDLELDGAIKGSPIVAENVVYIGTEAGTAYAVGAKSGRVVWDATLDHPILGTMAYENNRLYVATSSLDGASGTLYVLHAKTGAEIMKRDIGSGSYGGPVIEDGKVFVGTDAGKVVAYETEGMTKLWEFSTALTIKTSLLPSNTNDDCCLRSNVAAKAVKSVPISYDKRVYFSSFNQMLFAVDSGGNPGAETTNLVWAENLHDIVYSSAGIDPVRKVIVAGSYDGKLSSFNIAPYYWTDSCQNITTRTYHAVGNPCSSNIYWSYNTGSRIFSSPAIANDKAYVGDNDGTLHAVKLVGGVAAWTYKVGGGIYGSPAVAGSTIVVGAYDGKIYVFNETDKGVLAGDPYSFTLAGKLHSSPAIAGGIVYVASDQGKLYALAAPSAEPEKVATPDIAVQQVTLDPATPFVGQPLTVNVQLKNLGDADSSEAALRFYNGTYLMGEQLVLVAAGQTKTVSFSFTPTQVGAMDLRVVYDEAGALYEAAVDNNALTNTIVVADGSAAQQNDDATDGGGGGKKKNDEDAPATGLVSLLAVLGLAAVLVRRGARRD